MSSFPLFSWTTNAVYYSTDPHFPPRQPRQLEEAKGSSALPPPGPPPSANASTNADPAAAATSAEPVSLGKWEPVSTASVEGDAARPEGAAGSGRGVDRGGARAGAGAGAGNATGVFGVGSRVEVLSADKWYPAVSERKDGVV